MSKPLSGKRLAQFVRCAEGWAKLSIPFPKVNSREIAAMIAEIVLSRKLMEGLDEDYLPGNVLPDYRAYEAFLHGEKT